MYTSRTISRCKSTSPTYESYKGFDIQFLYRKPLHDISHLAAIVRTADGQLVREFIQDDDETTSLFKQKLFTYLDNVA